MPTDLPTWVETPATREYMGLGLGVGHPLKTIGGIQAISELLALLNAEHEARVRAEAQPLEFARLRVELEQAEAEVALRDKAMTLAYRLWLQGAHDEVGEYLRQYSTDLRTRAGDET